MGRRARRRPDRNGDPVAATLRVLAVGRARGPERELFERYATRMHPPLALTEIADGAGPPLEIRRREARALLARLPAGTMVVVLDQGGKALSSEALAHSLESWTQSGGEIVFVIGGAEGLDPSLLARADATLSLGPQTWPHLLARVMVAEQLYRARAILDGHPYHRAARPPTPRL